MSGGGVLVDGGSPKFITPRFENNGPFVDEQLISGGGLAVVGGGHATIESPQFLMNNAQVGGGLYVGSDASASLSVTVEAFVNFIGNTAYAVDSKGPLGDQPGLGGGLANFGDVTIQGAYKTGKGQFELSNNVAHGTSGMPGLGGGIYHAGTSLVLSVADFTNNHAGKGGGLYSATSGSVIEYGVFNGNSPNGVGGADASSTGLRGQPAVIVIDNCTIYGNGDDETDQQIDGLLVMHLGDNHISKHPPPSGCPSDHNGDGEVNGADLGLLIAAWGVCSMP